MGFLDAFRRKPDTGVFGQPIEETSRNQLGDAHRVGYEADIPLGGISDGVKARTHGSSRRQLMEELHQAYMTCPWVSTCADTVARLVTAGGIELRPKDGDIDQPRPPVIQQLDALLAAANEREDGVQLLRSTVTDLMVFGDGFIETGWIGDVLAALWTLDTTTMNVGADEHGNLTGYFQTLDSGRQADFDVDEVIHVSLDSPRGGIYGVSPTQKLHVTIVTWLFAAACLKEYYRRGMPPRLAIDLGSDTGPTDREKFRQNFQHKHLGPRNIGQPYLTTTGTPNSAFTPPVRELGVDQIQQLHDTLNRCRDEIIAGFGLSPAMVGVIESGNLGGGTGEAQAKATHYGTVLPIQSILLEKLNFAILTSRGVDDWEFGFTEVDYRDSKTIEDIRDMRLRNGAYLLNTYRAEIGEDPVPGGDKAVLVDRQNIVLWEDLDDFSKAQVASKDPAQQPAAVATKSAAAAAGLPAGDTDPAADDKGAPRETHLGEAWVRGFLNGLRQAS